MSNYYGEYDESVHDEDWWALSNRGEYNELVYGVERHYNDEYDPDNYGFDRYDSGEDT